MLKVPYLHLEHLVKHLYRGGGSTQSAGSLHALHCHLVERGRRRSALRDVVGIYMPSPVNGGREDDIALVVLAHTQLGSKVYRVKHLCIGRQTDKCSDYDIKKKSHCRDVKNLSQR